MVPAAHANNSQTDCRHDHDAAPIYELV